MASEEVTIDVKISNVAATLVNGSSRSDDVAPDFDVDVKLEELERATGEAVFDFSFAINTKPSVVRFDAGGTVAVSGENDRLEKLLETDPDTKVPHLLKRVYQQIFLSIFLLAGTVNAPHPPPDLLFSSVKSQLAQSPKES